MEEPRREPIEDMNARNGEERFPMDGNGRNAWIEEMEEMIREFRRMQNEREENGRRERDKPQLMKDFMKPTVQRATSCIYLEQIARDYDLKPQYYPLLPSFYGMSGEDPIDFIREYEEVISRIPIGHLTEDQLRRRIFPYTLKDKAKTWFLGLPDRSLRTWEEVFDKFMSNYYSHMKTSYLRRAITKFEQKDDEAFHEAWERFKSL